MKKRILEGILSLLFPFSSGGKMKKGREQSHDIDTAALALEFRRLTVRSELLSPGWTLQVIRRVNGSYSVALGETNPKEKMPRLVARGDTFTEALNKLVREVQDDPAYSEMWQEEMPIPIEGGCYCGCLSCTET